MIRVHSLKQKICFYTQFASKDLNNFFYFTLTLVIFVKFEEEYENKVYVVCSQREIKVNLNIKIETKIFTILWFKYLELYK